MRLSYILAAAILATSSTAFALDGGYGVGSLGPSAHVTTSLNRSLDNFNATPGFSGTGYTAGRGVTVTLKPSTNATYSGSVNAMNTILDIRGGKGFGTQVNGAGRNDPMPILGGRGSRETVGGVDE